MFISNFHRIFWIGRDPQASLSPALKWMGHTGVKPMVLVLLAPGLTKAAEVRGVTVNSSDERTLYESTAARPLWLRNWVILRLNFQENKGWGMLGWGWSAWVWVCSVLHQPLCCPEDQWCQQGTCLEPSHPGGSVRKEKLFRGSTVPSDCVCVSIHTAAGQAATWEWEKATSGWRAFEMALSLGVNHNSVIGTIPKVVFVLQPLQITCLHLSTHTPLPITLGSADWFKRWAGQKLLPFLLPQSAETKRLLVN